MAKNPPPGHGRVGEVKKRIQVWNQKIKKFTKIDTKTHLFIDQKSDKDKFKGVRMYKKRK